MAQGFNINELVGEIRRGGLMRNNKFLVEFPMPPSLRNTIGIELLTDTNRVLSLYCEGTNLPGVGLMTEEIRRYGYGSNEKKPYVPIFTDVNLTFRGDSNGSVWTFLNAWMKATVHYEGRDTMNTPTGPIKGQHQAEVGYKNDTENHEGYAVPVTITMFNDMGEPTIRVVLREAFPIFVGDIPLNWGARSDYMRIPVTLSFFDWYNDLVQTNSKENSDPRFSPT